MNTKMYRSRWNNVGNCLFAAVLLLLLASGGLQAAARDGLNKQLLKACEDGSLQQVQDLLEAGADTRSSRAQVINAATNQGWMPLHRAAYSGHIMIVRFLVEKHNADVNATDHFGQTALYWAATKGHIGIVRFLVEEHKVAINVATTQGWTPLHDAARNGHEAVVKFLVEQRADTGSRFYYSSLAGQASRAQIINAADNDGHTALYWSAHNGHLNVAKLLVEQGADINAKDQRGHSALQIAARNGHMEVVKFLLEQDCLRHKVTSEHESERNYGSQGAGVRSSFHSSSFVGQARWGKYINIADDACVALYWAAMCGHLDVVKFLVEEHGADINTMDQRGHSPLHKAVINGHLEVAQYLVEQGAEADINSVVERGQTALLMAARNGHVEVVKFLVEELGADINATDEYGHTTLYRAAVANNHKLAACLVECGADANVTDERGRTISHKLAREGEVEAMKCMIEVGADLSLVDQRGRTPRDVGGRQIVELIDEVALKRTAVAGIESEWRSHNHDRLPRKYRDAMSTLVILAKAGL